MFKKLWEYRWPIFDATVVGILVANAVFNFAHQRWEGVMLSLTTIAIIAMARYIQYLQVKIEVFELAHILEAKKDQLEKLQKLKEETT